MVFIFGGKMEKNISREITPIGFRAWGAPISCLFLATLKEQVYNKIASHAYQISGLGGTHLTKFAFQFASRRKKTAR